MRVVGHAVAALTAAAALPVAAGALLLQPRWRIGLDERLGRPSGVAPGAVWLHAASVGEILAARRLVDALRARGRSVFTT
ncbi:MAG: glycosyltransferase N-terminal domain-containing protein, partial [Planctomycetota bacterium]